MKGIVMWYNVQRGFGMIRGEDGLEYFAHRSQVPFWSIFLNEGDCVSFSIEDSSRGPKAVDVNVLEEKR